jgi:hypothetical protein
MDIDAKELAKAYAELTGEELLRLHASGELTDTAYGALESELTRRGIRIPQRKDKCGPEERRPLSFRDFWEGKADLVYAYWLIGTAGNFIFSLIFTALENLGWTIISIVFSIFWLAYFVFASVSIWRCAWNVKWKGWGFFARIMVVFNVIGAATAIFVEFMPMFLDFLSRF